MRVVHKRHQTIGCSTDDKPRTEHDSDGVIQVVVVPQGRNGCLLVFNGHRLAPVAWPRTCFLVAHGTWSGRMHVKSESQQVRWNQINLAVDIIEVCICLITSVCSNETHVRMEVTDHRIHTYGNSDANPTRCVRHLPKHDAKQRRQVAMFFQNAHNDTYTLSKCVALSCTRAI